MENEQGNGNKSSNQQQEFDESKPDTNSSIVTAGRTMIILGVAMLLLCPGLFFGLIALFSKKGNSNVEAIEIASTWILYQTLGGWIFSEIGLSLSKPRGIVKVLARVSIYLYIALGLVLLFFIHAITHMGTWP